MKYSVVFQPSLPGASKQVLRPLQNTHSSEVPEKGSFTIDQKGVVQFVFDNSWSLLTDVALKLTISVAQLEQPGRNVELLGAGFVAP
jgi:hypothetical protein